MNKAVAVKAFAKINLSIDILGKMENGYHSIKTVMQQVDLYDDIVIESKGKAGLFAGYKISLEINDSNNPDSNNSAEIELPQGDDNLAYRAAKIMAETYCPLKDNNITIKLVKRIPMAAGLAGGSSDAAAVMLGLCKLWNIDTPLKELFKIGADIGADIPFCITGNAKNNPSLGFSKDEIASSAALAEGIGEIITPLPSLRGWVILAKPDISVSTEYVYRQLSEYKVLPGQGKEIEIPDTEKLIDGLENNNYMQVLKSMTNVLETVSLKEYPIVVYTKNKIAEITSSQKILMSGSGPTVFAYFNDEKSTHEAFKKICDTLLGESGYKYNIQSAKLL